MIFCIRFTCFQYRKLNWNDFFACVLYIWKILNWSSISIITIEIMKHIMRLGNISLKSYRLIFRFLCLIMAMFLYVRLLRVTERTFTWLQFLKKHAPLHEYFIDNVTSYKTHNQPRIIDVKYLHLKFHMYSCPEKVISL